MKSRKEQLEQPKQEAYLAEKERRENDPSYLPLKEARKKKRGQTSSRETLKLKK